MPRRKKQRPAEDSDEVDERRFRIGDICSRDSQQYIIQNITQQGNTKILTLGNLLSDSESSTLVQIQVDSREVKEISLKISIYFPEQEQPVEITERQKDDIEKIIECFKLCNNFGLDDVVDYDKLCDITNKIK